MNYFIRKCKKENVCVIGDFNAPPGSRRYSALQAVYEDHRLRVAGVALLPNDTFTHVNLGSLAVINVIVTGKAMPTSVFVTANDKNKSIS